MDLTLAANVLCHDTNKTGCVIPLKPNAVLTHEATHLAGPATLWVWHLTCGRSPTGGSSGFEKNLFQKYLKI